MEDTNHNSPTTNSGPGSGTNSTPNSTHDNPVNSSPTSNNNNNNNPNSGNPENPNSDRRHSHNNNTNTDTSTGQEHSDSSMSNPVNDKVDTNEKTNNSINDNPAFDLSYFDGIYKTKEKDDPLDLSYFESPYDKNKIEEYLKRNVETGNQLAYNKQDIADSNNRIGNIQSSLDLSGIVDRIIPGAGGDFPVIRDNVKNTLQNVYSEVSNNGTVSDRHITDLDTAIETINRRLSESEDSLIPRSSDYDDKYRQLKREIEFAKEKINDIKNNGVTKNTGISSASERQQIEGQLSNAKNNLQAAYESGDPTRIENAKQAYERVANRVKQDYEGSTVMENIWRNGSNPETLFNRMEEEHRTTPATETPTRTEPVREAPSTPSTPSTETPTRTEPVRETPTTPSTETSETTPVETETTTTEDTTTTPTETSESTETETEEEIPEEISSDVDADTEELVDAMSGIDRKGRWWQHGSDDYERVRKQIKRVSPSAEEEFMDFAQNIEDIIDGTAGQKVKAVLKLVSKAAWDTFNIIPKLCGDMVKDIIYRLIKGDYDTSGLTDAEQKQVKRFAQNKRNVSMMNSMLNTMDKPIESSIRGKGRGQATDESDYNEGLIEQTNDVTSDVNKKYIINHPWVFKAIQRW